MKPDHYIYILYYHKKIVYIGCSMNPEGRVKSHDRDKKFNKYDVLGPYIIRDAYKKEADLIQLNKPKYNIAHDVVGRKPIPELEKIVQVNFYTKKSVIENVGGMDQARLLAKAHLENF